MISFSQHFYGVSFKRNDLGGRLKSVDTRFATGNRYKTLDSISGD